MSDMTLVCGLTDGTKEACLLSTIRDLARSGKNDAVVEGSSGVTYLRDSDNPVGHASFAGAGAGGFVVFRRKD
jgi:hypothetical protein